VVDVLAGGVTRAGSVRIGLERLKAAEFVLVHDAARPAASPRLVQSVLEATLAHGAAVPVLRIGDTVKEEDAHGFAARTLPRGPLRLAQTPQGARTDWLIEALDAAAEAGAEVTDEGQALERAGRRVKLVEGEAGNRKITTEDDLREVARRLDPVPAALRVGTGYDVHPFADGRALVLGGVAFPGERGLAGHSDADVVLHAAMDAVLGAAGLPDIGAHFPNDDPALRGADSRALASAVAAKVRAAGFAIVNVDVTVLAERPRIGPKVPEMRAAIARAFGLAIERVGVKATTLEGLGSLGRGEGIACQAVALVAQETAE
jgi:2-C-methyl-D-erythritol 4-phosphate cytidylyltransferase/2-C-methyl-D-erythritol 2,4-cyclodiphosphate synthase